jgi:MATH domain
MPSYQSSFQCSYLWKIDRFLEQYNSNPDVVFESPEFPQGAETRWKMQLYRNEQNPKYLICYLHLASSREEPIFAKYRLSVLDTIGRIKFYVDNFDEGFQFSSNEGCGTEEFITINDARKLLDHGTLTILGQVKFYSD